MRAAFDSVIEDTTRTEPMAELFEDNNPLAMRQRKTDRLILPRYLEPASKDTRFEVDAKRAHAILLRWADLESKGRLEKLKETQLQGDFLAEVFGDALGYQRFVEGDSTWSLEQHQSVGSQTPDAVLGRFSHGQEPQISAVVELKGAKIHLDRGRSNERTAVDQCWDYLVNLPPTCRWGIVSNFVSFRLYERSSTKRRYEHFSLQSLRKFDTFREFFTLFSYDGLVKSKYHAKPQAVQLLEQTSQRQRTVGDTLYQTYSQKRTDLIQELHLEKGHSLTDAIEWAQRLFDRVIFIAFCEDRNLLPKKTLETAWDVKGFHAVTNPRWQSYKNLFRMVDGGGPALSGIPAYNGGLFARSPVDDLELDDDRYTGFFKELGNYDFADEVNLDVLGHLFERSITEVEKLKETGFFGGSAEKAQAFAQMPQSAKRKRLGIYYTPPELTSRIVQYTVEELILERFKALGGDPESPETARLRLNILRRLKIVDPACGSGAFLFQAYDLLDNVYDDVLARLPEPERQQHAAQVPAYILNDNLYGVDLSPEAVEITQLALWIRSANRDQKLARLSHNIAHGNSLVADPSVDPHAFDWKTRFPEVFEREEAGFDCVIGNPPWERIKLQEREFFSLPAPEIATTANAAKRRRFVEKLEVDEPATYLAYIAALDASAKLRNYCQQSGHYPLTGHGDINTFAVFTELSSKLVAPTGRVGLIIPSGIATDHPTKDFFGRISGSNRIFRFYDFENKKAFFEDVHGSFKFCMLTFGGEGVTNATADFVFFAHSVEDLERKNRHINLTGDDIKLLNPNTRTCPIFRTRRDGDITKSIYKRIPILIDRGRKKTGNLWGISFGTVFHQTGDAEYFIEEGDASAGGFEAIGNCFVDHRASPAQEYLPLYEAKMFRPYDHRYGSAFSDAEAWLQQGRTTETLLVEHQNPEYFVIPRYWAKREIVEKQLPRSSVVLAYRNIARATDTRTFLPCFVPYVGLLHSAPFITTVQSLTRQLCLMANLYSFPLDFVARNKIGGTNMTFFIVEQLPILPPDRYDEPCPWQKDKTLEAWIAERVLKLTCTAEDMLPLADACGFTAGSFKSEYGGRLHKWNERERAELMAELDAAFFHLYGLDHDDAEYVLSTFKGIHEASPLLSGHPSTAKFILELFDAYGMQMPQ